MKNSQALKNGRKGFTLVELVVTLVILGILLLAIFLIALPPIQRARENVCGSNKQGLVSMTMLYIEECRQKGIAIPASITAADFASDSNALGRSLTANPAECPNGGIYTIIIDPEIEVICGYHD